jgi:hypothetical protein
MTQRKRGDEEQHDLGRVLMLLLPNVASSQRSAPIVRGIVGPSSLSHHSRKEPNFPYLPLSTRMLWFVLVNLSRMRKLKSRSLRMYRDHDESQSIVDAV